MYTFYYSPGACSLGPHIVLEEVGASYERSIVKAGEATRTDAWRAINPKGRVPALAGVAGTIGGQGDLLTEANAIMIFLARSYPAAQLIPEEPAREARMIEWLNYISSGIHASIYASIRRTDRFVDDPALYPPIQEKGKRALRDAFGYIEGLLADGRDWAVPGSYSLADIYLLVFYYFGRAPLFDMRTEFPAWAALVDKVAARPAAQRVIAIEGLTLP